MITIKNGLVLVGFNLEAKKTNVIINDEGTIIKLSPHDEAGEIIDATGCIVMPAFINAHTHIGDAIAKDVGDGLSLDELVAPPNGLKHQLLNSATDAQLVDAMHEAAKEMMYNGISTFIDFREGGLHGIKLLKEAIYDLPINACILGRSDKFYDPEVSADEIAMETRELLRNCDGIGLSGIADMDYERILQIADICNQEDKLIMIHAAEYYDLQEKAVQLTNQTEVELSLKAGISNLVHVTSPILTDLDLLSASAATVVSCPRSNGMLSSGMPPIAAYNEEGIDVALGSDNVMFNSPDMFREMEYALKSSRGAYKNKITAHDILKMATINGFKILGKDISIMEGNVSDILIIRQKSDDPYLSVVNRSSPEDIMNFIMSNQM
ncbi:MAG: amidohydrolase family protein [Methanosphaera sp.]|uniref:amidohydrolase family protein n=1 Tax=Methanosphaera sp. TaxID=2666342 RepID=UPI0025D699D6|nr:amidohydrolase family protein [Methanosphaera sp.]MCI5867311.1 amidohydrolase family protein [Methanosphaera sp.]MDD6534621.1 amidohydrolase family protein [Methanosphaera sp.]MDY3955711.1 amidohydrolase family protein [Methanosphaera sp.]